MTIICKLCGRECSSLRVLGIHLNKSHKSDITLQNYYDTYLKTNSNEGICKNCGKSTHFLSLKGYRMYCSHQCQVSSTETIEHARQTKFKNNGKGNYFSKAGLESIRKKNSENSKERLEKTIKNIKKKHNIPDNVEITNISQFQFVKDKKEGKSLEKFGCTCTLHNPKIHEKTIKTNIKNWGTEYPQQSHKFRENCKRKFEYNNITFDSKWEIAYFIWLQDHNIDFKYQPEALPYEYKGKTKYYHPDFKVENKFIEIKNSYELNKMITLVESQEHYKYLCMINNNVKIIDDCTLYVDYVNSKYGKELLKKCKRIKTNSRHKQHENEIKICGG